MNLELEMIEIDKENTNNYIGLDIVAFHWAAPGACGEHGGVIFISRQGVVYHTNYVYRHGITFNDLFRIFPPLRDFNPGLFGGGHFPVQWKDHYLGMGNYLVIHESIWADFKQISQIELSKCNNGNNILYNIWIDLVLTILKDKDHHN